MGRMLDGRDQCEHIYGAQGELMAAKVNLALPFSITDTPKEKKAPVT